MSTPSLDCSANFSCVFVLFGCSWFWIYKKRGGSSAGPHGLPQTLRATLLGIAAPFAAISGVGRLALILINMTRYYGSVVDPEDLGLYFFETPFGTVSFLRLALLAIAVVMMPLLISAKKTTM